jgi:hypothetical protein
LRKFYGEARNKNGEEYGRSSLLQIRNSIERYLNYPPHNRALQISKNPEFASSNQMLNATLKSLKRRGKENIQHKSPVEVTDLKKLKTSGVLSNDNPLGLLRNVWFHVTLYWCRRGREGQRQLRPDSFTFQEDADGAAYVEMTHDEATKNHPGGLQDNGSNEKEGRMYATRDEEDGYHSLKKYLKLINPKCLAFFQRPKASRPLDGTPWFENKPLGVNTLSSMMKEISKAAKLSRVYTNHCVRASAITLWSEAGLASRHIMKISGHRSEHSLKHYNDRPSTAQLKNCSHVLSEALGRQNATDHLDKLPDQVPFLPLESSSSVSFPLGHFSIPNMFNSCSIKDVKISINTTQ